MVFADCDLLHCHLLTACGFCVHSKDIVVHISSHVIHFPGIDLLHVPPTTQPVYVFSVKLSSEMVSEIDHFQIYLCAYAVVFSTRILDFFSCVCTSFFTFVAVELQQHCELLIIKH